MENKKTISNAPTFPLSKALWKKAKIEYSKPERTYHNVEYITQGFQKFKDLYVNMSMAQEIAWIAHKVVNDPSRADNEARSAAWIDEAFKSARLEVGERTVVREAKLIVESIIDYVPKVPSAEPLLDVVLSRLAVGDWATFEEYAWRLKEESPDFPEVEWIKRSKAFAQSLLERPQVFFMPEAKRRWERRLKENLINSIEAHPLNQPRLFGSQPEM